MPRIHEKTAKWSAEAKDAIEEKAYFSICLGSILSDRVNKSCLSRVVRHSFIHAMLGGCHNHMAESTIHPVVGRLLCLSSITLCLLPTTLHRQKH